MTKEPQAPRLIAENRKARFDYFIEERYEAGMSLEGWEGKAMRAGRAQLKEAYVYLRGGEGPRLAAGSRATAAARSLDDAAGDAGSGRRGNLASTGASHAAMQQHGA